MINQKANVADQAPPKQRGDQIVSSAAPEKNKNDSASERNEKVAFGVKQSEAEQADLREKDVAEKKRRTETQRLVTQETESPGKSRERERDSGTRRPIRGRMEPARPGIDREKLRFESDENREGDVALSDHEQVIGPGKFHDNGAGRGGENAI